MTAAKLLLPLLLSAAVLFAQESNTPSLTMPPVVVTANRVPLHSLQVNRLIEVIDYTVIQAMHAASIEELLQNLTTIDLQPRGPFGVQTDISVRGALFSQTLLLLNGVRVNDPQTAHHNFDLPISLHEIERIEVMKGPGSALYGPDAYGGVINIITKKAIDEKMHVTGGAGEHGFASARGSIETLFTGFRTSATAEFRRSAGYRYGTDFSIWNVSSQSSFDLLDQNYTVIAGLTEKEFGAFDFYSPGRNVPSREWTTTAFGNIGTQYVLDPILLEPKVYYRYHDDKFMFDVRTPDRFVNKHKTQSYGGEVMGTVALTEYVSMVSGIEIAADQIRSSRLGNHSRSSVGVLVNMRSRLTDWLSVDAGFRQDFNSTYGSIWNPAVGIGITPLRALKIFAHAGKSFRAPGYTELFYSDPANIGNADLHPEIGWSYEAGVQNQLPSGLIFSASIFLRDQSNLIDYVQYFSGDLYHAVNFTSARTKGAEASFEWIKIEGADKGKDFGIKRAMLQYAFLDSHIERGNIFRSKYSLSHPKHQVTMHVSALLPFSISSQLSAVHKIKPSGKQYTLVDVRLARDFPLFNLSLKASNLLNTPYEEIAGIPLPGRWITGEVGFSL